MTAHLKQSDKAPNFSADTVYNGEIDLKSMTTDGKKVLLAFHRYASCPICNFSLRQFGQRHQELLEKGIVYIPVFHSTAETMKESYPEAPDFPIVVDPNMTLYKLYGLKPSLLAIFHPKALLDMLKMFNSILQPGYQFKLSPDKTLLTRPADFLINEELKIEQVHYGVSLGDSLGIDEVLAF